MEQFISKEAFEKIKLELENLKEKRKEISERLKKSASYGDLSENSEYQQAREDKELLEKKILEIEGKLKNFKIKKGGTHYNKKSEPYSKIKVKRRKEVLNFVLVSPEEINLAEGKISYDSPLGRELLGREKGDKIEVSTPGGKEVYEILEVSN